MPTKLFVEGGFLTESESNELVKLIESNYTNEIKFGSKNNDIRQRIFNYEHPFTSYDINGTNYRVCCGLTEWVDNVGRVTSLLYANGVIIGKFYSMEDGVEAIKYIKSHGITTLFVVD